VKTRPRNAVRRAGADPTHTATGSRTKASRKSQVAEAIFDALKMIQRLPASVPPRLHVGSVVFQGLPPAEMPISDPTKQAAISATSLAHSVAKYLPVVLLARLAPVGQFVDGRLVVGTKDCRTFTVRQLDVITGDVVERPFPPCRMSALVARISSSAGA